MATLPKCSSLLTSVSKGVVWCFFCYFYGEFWSVKFIETKVSMKTIGTNLTEINQNSAWNRLCHSSFWFFKLCFDGSLLGPCYLLSSKQKTRNKTSKQKSSIGLCTILLIENSDLCHLVRQISNWQIVLPCRKLTRKWKSLKRVLSPSWYSWPYAVTS